jgi:hypothetical protein
MTATETKPVKALTASERAILEKHGHKVLHYADGTEVCKVTCPRCGGTGSYSFCQMHGTDCFQCNVASGGKHIGYVYELATKTARRLKRNEAVERKAAKRAEAKAANDAADALALEGLALVTLESVLAETYRLRAVRAAEAKARKEADVAAGNEWLLKALRSVPYPSEFVASMLDKLSREPALGLSDRCLDILADIYCKVVSENARRNSKAYDAARDEFEAKLGRE